MEECLDLHKSLLTSLESFRKLRHKLEALSREIEARKKRSTSREGAFVTPVPLWSSRDFGFWVAKVIQRTVAPKVVEICW